MSGNRTLLDTTQAGEPRIASQKISASTSPLTSDHLTPQIAIIMCGVQLSKSPRKTKDELKARITAAFTNLNKENVGKTCKRF